MQITLSQLKQAMPLAQKPELFLAPLSAAMQEFGITTEKRIECFLAQIEIESGSLRDLSENLNYSAVGLANTWETRYAHKGPNGQYLKSNGKFVPNQLALTLQRKPEAIANNTYANRFGNGDIASGDGWRYRGAGLIQLTFKDNHARCAEYFKIPLAKIGDWLRTPEGACRSAGWYWQTKGCNELADKAVDAASFLQLTKKVNGGAIGAAQRFTEWQNNKPII